MFQGIFVLLFANMELLEKVLAYFQENASYPLQICMNFPPENDPLFK